MGQNKNCLSQARVRIFVVFAYLPIDGIVQMQVITIKTGPGPVVPSYPISECKMWNALVALVALEVASKWRSSLSQACSLRKGTEVAGAALTCISLSFLFGQKLLKGFEC